MEMQEQSRLHPADGPSGKESNIEGIQLQPPLFNSSRGYQQYNARELYGHCMTALPGRINAAGEPRGVLSH